MASGEGTGQGDGQVGGFGWGLGGVMQYLDAVGGGVEVYHAGECVGCARDGDDGFPVGVQV